MRRSPAVILVLFLAVAVAIPTAAKIFPATKAKIESDLRSKNYVAKIELYDVIVSPEGVPYTEYDKEAIKKGQKIIIKKIDFSKKEIRMTLQHPYLNEKIGIKFIFDRPISDDFSQEEELWKKMIDGIFEEEGAGEGE